MRIASKFLSPLKKKIKIKPIIKNRLRLKRKQNYFESDAVACSVKIFKTRNKDSMYIPNGR